MTRLIGDFCKTQYGTIVRIDYITRYGNLGDSNEIAQLRYNRQRVMMTPLELIELTNLLDEEIVILKLTHGALDEYFDTLPSTWVRLKERN